MVLSANDLLELNARIAAVEAKAAGHDGALDHLWLLVCGALVMFMQAGFAMLEAGTCRAKNVQNILMKNLVDVCVGTLGWWVLGWAIAYGSQGDDCDIGTGEGCNKFIGTSGFVGHDFYTVVDKKLVPSGRHALDWFFQWAFCSAAATIVSGGVAERVKFGGYAIYSTLMTAFIYPVVVAWTWSLAGWLNFSVSREGYMDFAGSGIVHMTGGVGALVGAIIAGPRTNRWEKEEEFAPHSLPLVVLGTFILWFGWYGFNCGSTLGMADGTTGALAAQVAMNTTLAAATGGISVFLIRLATLKKYDIGGLCNGILAGLVSITAPCGNVHSHSAFVIGLVGAIFYECTSLAIKKLKIDDPLDAFAIHGACGAWGVLAAALFDWGEGFSVVSAWNGFGCHADDNGVCLEGMGGDLLAVNVVGILAIAGWVAAWSCVVFLPLRMGGLLRVDSSDETGGLDTKEHSPPKAYNMGEPS